MDCKRLDYKNIPVQADIIAGIIHLDVESNNCFRDLDKYVHSDQGVATLVLRVVNSALYSRGRKITTIPMAISMLGFNVVRSLAMLAFSRSLFSQTREPLFRLHIWQHSLLAAIAARGLCQSLGQGKARDEAFIAGLMHDMGKVLLFTHDPKRYLQVLARVLDEGVPSVESERELFGCDHCEVGREAVTQWKLPERFADYMGARLDLAIDPATGAPVAADPVRLSLAGANVLLDDLGIGARAITEVDVRNDRLAALGLPAEQCAQCLLEDYLPGLMEDESYKLCANL